MTLRKNNLLLVGFASKTSKCGIIIWCVQRSLRVEAVFQTQQLQNVLFLNQYSKGV